MEKAFMYIRRRYSTKKWQWTCTNITFPCKTQDNGSCILTDALSGINRYHIAGNFQGRKLQGFIAIRKSFICEIGGRGIFGSDTSEPFAKVFSVKILFPPNRESFIPRKFPAIRYAKINV